MCARRAACPTKSRRLAVVSNNRCNSSETGRLPHFAGRTLILMCLRVWGGWPTAQLITFLQCVLKGLPKIPGTARVCRHLAGRGRLAPCNLRPQKTTARGFEPLRAEPNGFRVHLLNRSDTLSCTAVLQRVGVTAPVEDRIVKCGLTYALCCNHLKQICCRMASRTDAHNANNAG